MWLFKRALFLEIFRDPFSRFFWLCGTLCIAGAAILLIRAVFPAFSLELIQHKEQDAFQLTEHLIHEYQLDKNTLTRSYFGPEVRQRLTRMAQDFQLYKIRVYDAQGTIVFSSIAAEIGEKNTHDYFQKTVASGHSFSKLTRKNSLSLEGVHLLRDMVETYFPLMKGKHFIGAIEIYTDVSATSHSIDRLIGYMETVTIILALVFFSSMTLFLLAHAKQQLDARKHRLLVAEMEQIMRHDLKGPLSTLIHGFDFFIQDTSPSSNQYVLFQDLKKVAYRMLHTINSSLTLRKIERGGFVITQEAVDIAVLLANIQDDLSQLIQQKGLTAVIRHKNAQERFLVSGDHALLYSILTNLFKNAIEASAKNKEISITLFSQMDSQSIAITNDGAVPAAIRGTFFNKYVTSSKPGGTGFGTYAAKLMTEIQGGSIRLECNDDAGTTTVYLSFDSKIPN